ncbi:MAG: carboxypeptidase regulatory-like domain-containing protein, partial [Melioribacteraceae bacterium]
MLAPRKILLILLIILLSSPYSAFSQQRRPGGGPGGQRAGSGIVTGTVFDQKTSQPIEVATIMLFNSKDSTGITGGSTNAKGEFTIENVPGGTFYAR